MKGRPKGSIKYAPSFVERMLTDYPQTINEITTKCKQHAPDIHFITVNKLLKILERDGKATCKKVSKYYIWTKANEFE